CQHFNSAPYSF
nr:immunoglobulin light chain junction region [Macaca mulatta]